MSGDVHVYPVRIYYDDTDAGGVVYYANFLKMTERARTEMLRMLGFEHFTLAGEHGVRLAVRRCEIDYLRPAHLDDLLQIHTRITKLGRASVHAAQDVHRAGANIARLTLRLACITSSGRAARIPDALYMSLKRFVNQRATTRGKQT